MTLKPQPRTHINMDEWRVESKSCHRCRHRWGRLTKCPWMCRSCYRHLIPVKLAECCHVVMLVSVSSTVTSSGGSSEEGAYYELKLKRAKSYLDLYLDKWLNGRPHFAYFQIILVTDVKCDPFIFTALLLQFNNPAWPLQHFCID